MEHWDTYVRYRNTLDYKEHIPTNGVYLQLNETIMRLIPRDGANTDQGTCFQGTSGAGKKNREGELRKIKK